jgi:hypothetical protein
VCFECCHDGQHQRQQHDRQTEGAGVGGHVSSPSSACAWFGAPLSQRSTRAVLSFCTVILCSRTDSPDKREWGEEKWQYGPRLVREGITLWVSLKQGRMGGQNGTVFVGCRISILNFSVAMSADTESVGSSSPEDSDSDSSFFFFFSFFLPPPFFFLPPPPFFCDREVLSRPGRAKPALREERESPWAVGSFDNLDRLDSGPSGQWTEWAVGSGLWADSTLGRGYAP